MREERYRFFGGLLQWQEAWLNRMARQGRRLVAVDKLRYAFEECTPGSVAYRVEYIGGKSQDTARDYAQFLEDMGYKVFFKNRNLNWSVGKARYRPWAEKGGRIATNGTTYNRELLIVEKETDGTPFALHTDFGDQIQYYKSLRAPYATLVLLLLLAGIWGRSVWLGAWALLPLVPTVVYQRQIGKLKKEGRTKEW